MPPFLCLHKVLWPQESTNFVWTKYTRTRERSIDCTGHIQHTICSLLLAALLLILFIYISSSPEGMCVSASSFNNLKYSTITHGFLSLTWTTSLPHKNTNAHSITRSMPPMMYMYTAPFYQSRAPLLGSRFFPLNSFFLSLPISIYSSHITSQRIATQTRTHTNNLKPLRSAHKHIHLIIVKIVFHWNRCFLFVIGLPFSLKCHFRCKLIDR